MTDKLLTNASGRTLKVGETVCVNGTNVYLADAAVARPFTGLMLSDVEAGAAFSSKLIAAVENITMFDTPDNGVYMQRKGDDE